MADPIKPDIEAVKARVEAFRQELLNRVALAPDTPEPKTLKELLIHNGYTNVRIAAARDPLTLGELVDDLLLAIE
jgi:hypothetical protein